MYSKQDLLMCADRMSLGFSWLSFDNVPAMLRFAADLLDKNVRQHAMLEAKDVMIKQEHAAAEKYGARLNALIDINLTNGWYTEEDEINEAIDEYLLSRGIKP